jgi:hypothetical protein
MCEASQVSCGVFSAADIRRQRKQRKKQREASLKAMPTAGMLVVQQQPLPFQQLHMQAPWPTCMPWPTCVQWPTYMPVPTTPPGYSWTVPMPMPVMPPQLQSTPDDGHLQLLSSQDAEDHSEVLSVSGSSASLRFRRDVDGADVDGAESLLEMGMEKLTATEDEVTLLTTRGDRRLGHQNEAADEQPHDAASHAAAAPNESRSRRSSINQSRIDAMFGHVQLEGKKQQQPWKPPVLLVVGTFAMSQDEVGSDKKMFLQEGNHHAIANEIQDALGSGSDPVRTRFVATKVAFDASIIKGKTMPFVNRVVKQLEGVLIHGTALWSLGNEEQRSDADRSACRGRRQFYHYDWNVEKLQARGLTAWTLMFSADDDAMTGFARCVLTAESGGVPDKARFVCRWGKWCAFLFRHDFWHCGEIYKYFHLRVHYYINPKGCHDALEFRVSDDVLSKAKKPTEADLHLFVKENTEHYNNTAKVGVSAVEDHQRVTDVTQHPAFAAVSVADESWTERLKAVAQLPTDLPRKQDLPSNTKRKRRS